MKKERMVLGFLGLWLIILALLGFPSMVQRILIIITGLVIAFFSFWKVISENVAMLASETKKIESQANEKTY